MKKFKHHIISILFIILMIIFAVATSFPVDTELEIQNNSSSNIKVEISHRDGSFRDDMDDEKQKFELAMGQNTRIILGWRPNRHMSPESYIRSLIIRDKIGNIKKEYNQDDFFEEDFLVEEFFVFISERRGFFRRHVARFLLEITDELLE